MIGYIELAKMNVFSINDVEKLVNNNSTAYSLVRRLIKKGLVIKIRNNLYTCVEPQTGNPIASRYQIACAINESAYISHHTAFEYYGYGNQVYYEVYVASLNRFRDFEFLGFRYTSLKTKFLDGVISPKNTEGIRVSNLERTVIDSIKDFNKIAGFEELLACIEMLTYLDSDRLLRYLELYNLQILYQKTGFILEKFKENLKLPESFFKVCKSKIGKSTRYLLPNTGSGVTFNKEWNLVVPNDLFNSGNVGRDDIV